MNTTLSEAEILTLFELLGIATDEERRRLLVALGYAEAPPPPESQRFDIGFNAVFPSR